MHKQVRHIIKQRKQKPRNKNPVTATNILEHLEVFHRHKEMAGQFIKVCVLLPLIKEFNHQYTGQENNPEIPPIYKQKMN